MTRDQEKYLTELANQAEQIAYKIEAINVGNSLRAQAILEEAAIAARGVRIEIDRAVYVDKLFNQNSDNVVRLIG